MNDDLFLNSLFKFKSHWRFFENSAFSENWSGVVVLRYGFIINIFVQTNATDSPAEGFTHSGGVRVLKLLIQRHCNIQPIGILLPLCVRACVRNVYVRVRIPNWLGSSVNTTHCTITYTMDRLYPNFYSLHATPVDPLEPRLKRRSWNAFLDNPHLPYTVYAPVQEVPRQSSRRQRCSSEAPISRRISTFIPDNNNNHESDVNIELKANVDDQTDDISPIPPIAVVKPTVGRIDGRTIHRPQPCYGLPALSTSNDLPPPCMQMSTPEVFFNSSSCSSFKHPTLSLPRRRTQVRREKPMPVVRHSVFEYPNIVDYGPIQSGAMQDLTLRRRSRRHPELIATAPISRRMLFTDGNGAPGSMSCGEVERSNGLVMSNSLPPVCARSEAPRRNTRVSVDKKFCGI